MNKYSVLFLTAFYGLNLSVVNAINFHPELSLIIVKQDNEGYELTKFDYLKLKWSDSTRIEYNQILADDFSIISNNIFDQLQKNSKQMVFSKFDNTQEKKSFFLESLDQKYKCFFEVDEDFNNYTVMQIFTYDLEKILNSEKPQDSLMKIMAFKCLGVILGLAERLGLENQLIRFGLFINRLPKKIRRVFTRGPIEVEPEVPAVPDDELDKLIE
jgi:hypothetical protein